MAITKYIELNSGGVITLSSAHLWDNLPYGVTYLPNGRKGWGYDAGVSNISSPFDLTGLYDEAVSKIGISEEIWRSFALTSYTLEEITSESFQVLQDAVNGAISWLWGSMEDGGLGFVNVGGNIDCIFHQGIITVNDGGVTKYRYFISRGGIGNGHIDRSKIDNVVITLVDEGENRFPDIVIWCSHKDGVGNIYFQLDWTDPLSPTWYPHPAELASSYTNNCNMDWAPIYGSYPHKPWFQDNLSIYLISSSDTYDDFYMLGGFSGHDVTDDNDPFQDTTDTNNDGGNGGWGGSSESTPASDVDQIDTDAINSGFVTLYKATKPTIKSFCNWLWTDITDSIATQIKRLMTNPLDGILFIATTHLLPPTSQGSSEIKFCGIGSGVYSLTVPRQFSKFDCGYLQYVTNNGSYSETIQGDTDTFLDYQPYSKAEIYIPCIGYKELDVNDIIGSKIHLVLSVDWVSGAMLAQLEISRNKRKNGDAELNANTLYEYQGNIYTNLPISASDWKAFYSNVLQVAGGLASALSGNVGQGISQAVSSIATQQVSVQKSGNVSASYGYMGQQGIYMYLTRPNPAIPINYKGFEGYQTNQRYVLKELSGYTEIDDSTLWVDKFNGITETEAEMLREITRTGFYL